MAILVLAAIYIVFMISCALGYRLPPTTWKPAARNPDAAKKPLVTHGQVHLNVAWRTPQFCLWAVLTLNVAPRDWHPQYGLPLPRSASRYSCR